MGLFRRNKNNDKPVIKQIIDLVPRHILRAEIDQHKSDKGCHKYKTYDQFVAITFGQLNNCKSLKDISTGIGVCGTFITDLGLDQSPARSTMSDGNRKRGYQVFESLYSKLYVHYRGLLAQRGLTDQLEELENCRIKLIDSSTVTLCLSMFDWAKYRTAKGGIKLHTCIDEETLLPEIVNITEAAVHDRKGLKDLIFAPNTVIVEDRGYFDFRLMKSRDTAENTFVTRIKSNILYKSVEELDLPDGKDEHVLKDEIILLTSDKAKEAGMDTCKLRLVHVFKEDENKVIEIITNNLEWSASTVAALYKRRWAIELFFKALKQNLRVKTFWGTSENAVRSQIFIALIVYLLTELVKRVVVKGDIAYSTFIERIRMFLPFYLTLDYVCNQVGDGAKKGCGSVQQKMDFTPDLFSQ